jgi:RNA polymerase sigma-70 factor (ECF subfamily)
MSAELYPPPSAAEIPQTLGDVLYGADFPHRIPESEWIATLSSVAIGDTSAFGNLYMLTHGIVYTLIVRITGSRTVAEELTVEVFHDVWRLAREYGPDDGPVVGWIMNLARARAVARQRSDQAGRVALMRAAFDQLAPEERRAIEATYLAGSSSAAVAAQQGTTIDEVETRIRDALGKLGDIVKPADDSK